MEPIASNFFETPEKPIEESVHMPKKQLDRQTKEIIYRVYCFFKQEAEDLPEIKNFLKRTMDACGIPKTTICRIVREANEIDYVSSPTIKTMNEEIKNTTENISQETQHHQTPKKQLQRQAKEMAYKVYTFFKKESVELVEKPQFKNYLKRTIKALGMTKSTICRIVQEMNKTGQISSPKRNLKKLKSTSFRIRIKQKGKGNTKGETKEKTKKEKKQVFKDVPMLESVTVSHATEVTRPWV
ncbi:uncharacterized protein LOC123299995 [Chrysoperla carnea]|uniref:uncharacterized protein LOC123299995 n=1 Tax=Chrysoperla carnea TaxID=189513 RepID=UPI001D061256|nr:uncharacterized protein LOC123299995 [Chrysoperla carnea]